ncbi:MAG: hypothetical protein WKF31_01370 [Thermoleophilaceae bacterium]
MTASPARAMSRLSRRSSLSGSNGPPTWEGAQVAVPAALAGTVAAAYLGSRRANRSAARRGRALNQRLREVEFPVRSTPLPARAEE